MAPEAASEMKDVFLIIAFMAVMMISTFFFAGYIVWAHEQTAQTCINDGRIWQSDNCLP